MSEEEFFNQAFEEYLAQYNAKNPKHRFTQTRLADLLGVNKATITNWKNGIAKPKNRHLVLDLASALKLDRIQTDHLLRLAEYPLLADGETQKYRPGGAAAPQSTIMLAAKERCPDFCVERSALLGELSELFWATPSATNLAIHGIGGAGKTVLVASFLLQSEMQIIKAFQAGIIWIDLENQLLDPLLQISDQLGLEAAPESLNTLRQYIIERTRSLKLLWVIDGGETIAEAGPWLDLASNSKGCFIITLRETPDPGWLSQRKARALKVGDLQQEEGLKLTEKILQTTLPESEIPGWREMANLVGHHPLSLRILTGCAHFDPTAQRWENIVREIYQKGTLAIQVGDASLNGDRNVNVHRCLQISYERLQKRSPAAATCFRFLGILRGVEIPPELIKQLVGPEENAGHLLAILAQAGQVEVNHGYASYRIHQLMHLFARTLLRQTPEEYGLAGSRYVIALNQHLPAIPADICQAVRDPFVGEYIYAVDIACQVGLWVSALNILSRTYTILLGMGQSEQVKCAAESLLLVFTQIDQLKGEPLAWLYLIYGDILFSLMELDAALKQYEQVFDYAPSQLLLFKVHLRRAQCSYIMKWKMDLEYEIEAARRMLEALPEETKAVYLEEYTQVLRQVGLAKSDATGDPGSTLAKQISKAEDLLSDDRFSDGRDLLETLDRGLKDSPLIALHADVLRMLAYGYLQQNKTFQAHEMLVRLEGLLRASPGLPNARVLWAQLWQYRGFYELQCDQFRPAQECLMKSLKIWETIPGSETGQQQPIRDELREIARLLGD